jgi:hypothetical protein
MRRDLAALEGILMEGRGSLLLKQSSSDNRVAKFLKSVPKIMVSNSVTDVAEVFARQSWTTESFLLVRLITNNLK